MKNKKYLIIWGSFFFVIMFLLFSIIIFWFGNSSISREFEPLHKFVISQLEKESRKALTFSESYEGLSDIRIDLEKNSGYTISFILKDYNGNTVDSYVPSVASNASYTFDVPIHNLQSDVADLLNGASEKPTEKLGDLKVMFSYKNPIFASWLFLSFVIGFVTTLSVLGFYAIYQAFFYYREVNEQKEKITTLSVSIFKEKQAVLRAKSVIDRLYHYFEIEFKRPADIIHRHKKSEGSEELSSKALEKLVYNLETVLQARNKWLSNGLDCLVEATSDVYVIENFSCLSSLSLALESEEINLVSVNSKEEAKNLPNDSTCIFDLDPMVNNSSDIAEYINLLPNVYKIGIFSGAIDESEIYDMEFDVDWVIKDPLVSQITDAIKNKPKITAHLPFN